MKIDKFRLVNRYVINRFFCQPCNEVFPIPKYRYKISLEVSNLSKFRIVSAFGKSLETLFGIDCNKFVR